MDDEQMGMGPVEWAVVTGVRRRDGLLVLLEDGGEEAFMHFTGIGDHPLYGRN